jgi:chromosome segregation protein
MRLQRLEISGFKSFSDRAELSFDHGVTAIVGPNGCGKSNVADAILWVLGEQSAKSLRGDRMEDVIFNGSDARKPTGAAEVRLLLGGVTLPKAKKGGNGAGNGGETPGEVQLDLVSEIAKEVEVTRRLYRSGESEYLINGEICRLRDVHDLLMDTGLGAKAYAIIEQGKIGQILSSKPADRRQLIEEAAGVTKYKARRHAAELKLEASQQNLTRIDDIVFEVEKQRNALKRQAARARRYRRLRDELRHWEKVVFVRRYRQLAQTIEATRAELRARRDDERQAIEGLSAVEAGLARLRTELGEADAGATAARERAHGCEMEIDRRENQIALNRQQVEALEARAGELTQEIRELESRREPLCVELAEARAASERATTERASVEAALGSDAEAYDEARARLDGLDADVEAARKEVFTAINAATALQHAIEHAAQAREHVLETLSRLRAEASDLAVELGNVQDARAAAGASLQRAHEELEATGRERAARESELASMRVEHEWRVREMRAREQDLAGGRARLRSLEELQAGRAAYGEAARLVLQASAVTHHGSVADYLEVDGRFERAIEACLGDLLEHVVVVDREQAAAGLDFVREQAAGRCGFLIAGNARSLSSGVRRPESEGGFAGTAGVQTRKSRGTADLEIPESGGTAGLQTGGNKGLISIDAVVRVTGPFAEAIRSVFGLAWIAESRAIAERAAGAGRTIVTLDGDVFRGDAIVQGGAAGEARGILATKREIKELRERLEREETARDSLAAEIAQLESAIRETDQAVAALVAEQHRQEKAIVGLDLQVAQAAEEQQRIERKAGLLRIEIRRAEEERAGLEQRESEARESIARREDDRRIAEERLADAQRRLLDAREIVEVLSRRMGETKASYAALIERASALAAEVTRLEQASRELEARLLTRGDEIAHARARREELERTVVEQDRLLQDDRVALEQVKAQVQSAEERVASLRGDVEGHEVRIREARAALDQVRQAVNELELARVKAENDLTHLATSCLETLQASLDEVMQDIEALEGRPEPAVQALAADEEAEEESPEGGEAQAAAAEAERAQAPADPEAMIVALKEKIDRLGPVNMMAIEQFDELEQRHSFLTVQRKDLIDSIAATGEAIRRIDETTKQRFHEAFVVINATFQRTFQTLFGGGNAGLSLLDDSDLLDSGIEIIAQPPGKRLQSVQLLSGGEKALTAIALMFALFRYKPGPFCVLDEIDAPLDDANIGRFLEMLREMQENTQFILITHNRKTMEIADRLYGVTMEEPGVSKLISVRLN